MQDTAPSTASCIKLQLYWYFGTISKWVSNELAGLEKDSKWHWGIETDDIRTSNHESNEASKQQNTSISSFAENRCKNHSQVKLFHLLCICHSVETPLDVFEQTATLRMWWNCGSNRKLVRFYYSKVHKTATSQRQNVSWKRRWWANSPYHRRRHRVIRIWFSWEPWEHQKESQIHISVIRM